MASIRRIPGANPRKPRRTLSLGQGALILLVLLGGVFAFAAWRATKAVDAEIARWGHVFAIERGSVALGPTGRIGIEDLVIRAPNSVGDVPRVSIKHAKVAPGGAWTVFRSLIAGSVPGNSVPVKVELTGVSLLPGANPAPGGLVDRFVLFPFDMVGCGEGRIASISDVPGIAEGQLDVEINASRRGEEAEVRFNVSSHSIADALLELRLDGVDAGTWAQGLRGARLRGARFDLVDHGFAPARNRHCAAAQNIEESAAVERHVASVREWFAARYVEPAAPLLGVYRRLAEKGGTLEVNLRPRRPLPLSEFGVMALRDFSLNFGGTARVEGVVPATLSMSPLALPEGEGATAVAGSTALVQLSAAAEMAGASAGSVPAAIRFASGQTLEFDDLASLRGATLSVTSTLGVTRRGTLVKYTRAGIEVVLDRGDGGFRMSMPRDSIRSIVLVANPPLEAAPSTRN